MTTDDIRQSLLQLCQRCLGAGSQLITAYAGSNGTEALRIATPGGDVVVKRHRSLHRHHQEISAYQYWTPALGSQAPRLLGFDHEIQAIVLSAAPGLPLADVELPVGEQRTAHEQMGQALRRLHNAAPARDDINMTAWLAARGAAWFHAARHIIRAAERITIKAHLRELERLGQLPAVPCHLDFTLGNVLVDASKITVIDFEHARYDLAARDLVRLATRTWPHRPDLRAAFLRGYGPLTTLDEFVVDHCTYLDRLTFQARAAGLRIPDAAPPNGDWATAGR